MNTQIKKQADTGDGNNLPASWYEHPQAVQLLPAYQTVVGQVGQVKSLLDHYRQQKIAIAEGENWEALEQDANGKWGRKTYKADAAATAFVDDKIAELRAIESQVYRKAEELQTNYKQNAIRTREQVIAMEDQYFPQYKDAKELETNENWKAIRGLLDKFGLGQDRLSGVTAKMYVYTMSTLAENERLTKELEEVKKKLSATLQDDKAILQNQVRELEAENKRLESLLNVQDSKSIESDTKTQRNGKQSGNVRLFNKTNREIF